MRPVAVFLVALSFGGNALAHDFWLQPRSWQATPGVPMPISFEVGHGDARERWAAGEDKVRALNDIALGGTIDLRPLFRAGGEQPHLTRTFRREGLHIISMVSGDSVSILPATRFQEYLRLEGLTPAIVARQRSGRENSTGREYYSRRSKALIQVGRPNANDDRLAMRPIGLTLEVVPLRNPYSLGPGQPLPILILYEGRPLPGALVKLTRLEADALPLRSVRSDARGKVNFTIPKAGSWLINVVWTKPITSPQVQFSTVFSSLTFGYPAKPAR